MEIYGLQVWHCIPSSQLLVLVAVHGEVFMNQGGPRQSEWQSATYELPEVAACQTESLSGMQ